jgi:hypothetical protein
MNGTAVGGYKLCVARFKNNNSGRERKGPAFSGHNYGAARFMNNTSDK